MFNLEDYREKIDTKVEILRDVLTDQVSKVGKLYNNVDGQYKCLNKLISIKEDTNEMYDHFSSYRKQYHEYTLKVLEFLKEYSKDKNSTKYSSLEQIGDRLYELRSEAIGEFNSFCDEVQILTHEHNLRGEQYNEILETLDKGDIDYVESTIMDKETIKKRIEYNNLVVKAFDSDSEYPFDKIKNKDRLSRKIRYNIELIEKIRSKYDKENEEGVLMMDILLEYLNKLSMWDEGAKVQLYTEGTGIIKSF